MFHKHIYTEVFPTEGIVGEEEREGSWRGPRLARMLYLARGVGEMRGNWAMRLPAKEMGGSWARRLPAKEKLGEWITNLARAKGKDRLFHMGLAREAKNWRNGRGFIADPEAGEGASWG